MKTDKYLSLLAYVFMVGVNALASLLPLNDQTTAEISGRYPTLITPAGYVFAIWGLIYLTLAGFVVFQLLSESNQRLTRIRHLFIASSLLNAAWLFAWHWERLALSLVIMLALLVVLVATYLAVRQQEWESPAARWFLKLPFSIYLAWISVATIVNVSVVLYASGWEGWGISAVGWTVVLIVVATVLGASALLIRTDPTFALVIIWALTGVAANNTDITLVATTAWTAGVALAILVGWRTATCRL